MECVTNRSNVHPPNRPDAGTELYKNALAVSIVVKVVYFWRLDFPPYLAFHYEVSCHQEQAGTYGLNSQVHVE